MSMKTLVSLIALAILAVVLLDFVRAYMQATSAGWQRVWDAGRGSATIVVAQLGTVAGALVAASSQVTDWITGLLNTPGADEQIKSLIASYLTPTTVGIATVAFMALVAWARLRTLRKPVAS
jgi:hypothetical protein